MNINPALVMFKFLPLAMTFINFMTAFIFMNSCKPFIKMVNGSHNVITQSIHVNCSKTLVLSSTEKFVESGTYNFDTIEVYYVLKILSFIPSIFYRMDSISIAVQKLLAKEPRQPRH